MASTYTRAQIASHNTLADLWLVVSDEVYDLSKFQETHPGGAKILKTVAGKDATRAFRKHHNERILQRPMYRELVIGKIEERKADAIMEENEVEEGSDEKPGKLTSFFGLRKLKKVVLRQGVSEVVKSAGGTVLTTKA